MRPRAPYLGDPGTYESIVHDLVLDGGGQVLTLDDDHLVARGPWGVVVVVRLAVAAEPPIQQLVERLQQLGVVVVVAGGGTVEARAVLDPLAWPAYAWVNVLHVADDGAVEPSPPEDTPAAAVRAWLVEREPLAPDWERFWGTLGKAQALSAHADRLIRERLFARPPWITRTLVVAMVLIFGIEAVLGATRDAELLMMMGALYAPAVAAGQVWRVLSATLLHGNVLHAAVNLYVLWRLGDLVERVLGPSRYLLLYVLAGLGGSLASMLMPEHYSVGASGAIWGLMAAQYVLGARGEGKLPEPLRRSMKLAAGQNLLLNLLISFSPGIDWAAHLGGGLVGGLVTLMLVGGLPPWPEPGSPPVPPGAARPSYLVRVGAMVGGMALVGAAIMVIIGAIVAAPTAGLG